MKSPYSSPSANPPSFSRRLLMPSLCAIILMLAACAQGPQPERLTDAEADSQATQSAGDYTPHLPKMPPTESVVVLDLSLDKRTRGWRAVEALNAAQTIQGLVNRSSSEKIYFVGQGQRWRRKWVAPPTQEFALEGGLVPVPQTRPQVDESKEFPVLSYLLENYADVLEGKVRYAPLGRNNENFQSRHSGGLMAALTAAGQLDALPVSPYIESYLRGEGVDLPLLEDTTHLSEFIDLGPDPDLGIVIGTAAAGYGETGAWQNSNVAGYQRPSHRFSTSQGATASWTPSLPEAGTYEVFVWVPATCCTNNTTNAEYTIAFDGGSETVTVNQRQQTNAFRSLGRYPFAQGEAGSLTLTVAGGGNTRADAVLFQPSSAAPGNGDGGGTQPTAVEAFRWTKERYLTESTTRDFVAKLGLRYFGGHPPYQIMNIDYIIANRAFVYDLNANRAAEREVIPEILNAENFAPGTPVFGDVDGENIEIRAISDPGYTFSFFDGGNLTVHSSFPSNPEAIQAPRRPTAAPLDDNTVYVAFYVTDGDNFAHAINEHQHYWMNSPNAGEVPIGWSVPPMLFDVFPKLLEWRSANDYDDSYELVANQINGWEPATPAGEAAYVEQYRNYLDNTNGLFRTINHFYYGGAARGDRVVSGIGPYLNLRGYQGSQGGNPTSWYTLNDDAVSVTTMSGATQNIATADNIAAYVRAAMNASPEGEPTFVVAIAGDGGETGGGDSARNVKLAVDNLLADPQGRSYVFLRPQDLAATWRAYQGLDACPYPDQRSTVVIGTVDSGVANRDRGDGCTINDLILDEQPWANQGQFLNHVEEVTEALENDGVITGREGGTIRQAAARSGIGRP